MYRTPAHAAGGPRADADVVLWDSHPLQLGATRRKSGSTASRCSGAPRHTSRYLLRPTILSSQDLVDKVHSWTIVRECRAGMKRRQKRCDTRACRRRARRRPCKGEWLLLGTSGRCGLALPAKVLESVGQQHLTNRWLSHRAERAHCSLNDVADDSKTVYVDLQGGAIGPGLLTYGSPPGTEEINYEPSTPDGPLYDALAGDVPSILRNPGALAHCRRTAVWDAGRFVSGPADVCPRWS